jgi:hypothetical protein
MSVVEVSRRDYRLIPIPVVDRFDVAQRQLFLYLMRDYKSLPRQRQSRNRKLLAKAERREAEATILKEFAALAHQLGFESADIERRRKQTIDTQEQNIVLPLQSTGIPKRRNGIPHNHTYEKDKELLFLPNLHRHHLDEEFTSFFVLKSVYFAFFGTEIGESKSFEFTPSILEELSQVHAKRKRDSEDDTLGKRNAKRIGLPLAVSFQIWKDGRLEVIQRVKLSETSVREAAEEHMLKGLRPWTTEPKPLLAANVFDYAVSSKLYTVILLPETDVHIDIPLLKAMSEIQPVASVTPDDYEQIL